MSYRTDLTERLIEIPFLLAHRRHSRQELARNYQVNPNTISKDIDALTRNLPIEKIRKGREIFYGYPKDYKFVVPSFSPQEIGFLLLAQESIAGIGITTQGSPYAKYADSLIEKIRRSLPVAVVERINAVAAVYGSATVPAKSFSKHTAVIDRLANCAVSRVQVEMRYHGLTSNEIETRLIHPYAVFFDPDGATLKLIAFDLKNNRPSVFSVERIINLKESNEVFKRPADFNLKQYLEDTCFNGIHGEPVTVRLKAVGITARIFAERKFHPTQKKIEWKQRRGTSPETITIEMRVARGRGLTRFILSHLPNVEVVSPPEVREEVGEVLRQSLKNF